MAKVKVKRYDKVSKYPLVVANCQRVTDTTSYLQRGAYGVKVYQGQKHIDYLDRECDTLEQVKRTLQYLNTQISGTKGTVHIKVRGEMRTDTITMKGMVR